MRELDATTEELQELRGLLRPAYDSDEAVNGAVNKAASDILNNGTMHAEANKVTVVVGQGVDRLAMRLLLPDVACLPAVHVADPETSLLDGARLVLFCSGEPRKAIVRRIKGSGAKLASGQESTIQAITGKKATEGLSVVALLREKGVEGTRDAIRAIVEPKKGDEKPQLPTDWPQYTYADLLELAACHEPLPFVDVDEKQAQPRALLHLRLDGVRQPIGHEGALVALTAKQKVGKSALAAAIACSILATTETGAESHGGDSTLGFTSPCVGTLYVDTERGGRMLHSYWSVDSERGIFRHRMPHVAPAERKRRVRVVDAQLLDKSPLRLLRILQQAEDLQQELGGNVIVVIDKLDSFAPDSMLGAAEAYALVDALHKWTMSTGNLIVAVLHDNRVGGERGHVGTQLHDRAEALIRLTSESGQVRLSVPSARYANTSAGFIPLAYDENGLLQVDGEGIVKAGSLQAAEQVAELVDAFGSEPFTTQQAADLWKKSKEGARKRLNALAPMVKAMPATKGNAPATFRVHKPFDSDPE